MRGGPAPATQLFSISSIYNFLIPKELKVVISIEVNSGAMPLSRDLYKKVKPNLRSQLDFESCKGSSR